MMTNRKIAKGHSTHYVGGRYESDWTQESPEGRIGEDWMRQYVGDQVEVTMPRGGPE